MQDTSFVNTLFTRREQFGADQGAITTLRRQTYRLFSSISTKLRTLAELLKREGYTAHTGAS